MSESSSSTKPGIGFLSALALLFIGLKLTHNIDWPWYQVLFPLWIMFVLVLIGFFIALLAIYVKFKVRKHKLSKKNKVKKWN